MKLAKQILIDILFDLAGCFVLAVGIFCFAEKANIAPGGVSGLAIMAKYLWGLPVGLMTLALNIPIMLVAYRYLGRTFAWKTVKTLLINTVMLDAVVTPFVPQYTGDRMIGAIFGGVCMGIGLGIVFFRGSSTAGSDVLSYLLEQKYPHIQLGTALMLVDGVVLLLSMVVFQNIEAGLFGAIALLCQTKVLDSIVYGLDKGRKVLIISGWHEEIARRILNELGRSATLLPSKGAYSRRDTMVILCVIKMHEYRQLKEIVRQEDENAFMIVSEANHILGEGFRSITAK